MNKHIIINKKKKSRIVWAMFGYNDLAKSPIDFFFDGKTLGWKSENSATFWVNLLLNRF